MENENKIVYRSVCVFVERYNKQHSAGEYAAYNLSTRGGRQSEHATRSERGKGQTRKHRRVRQRGEPPPGANASEQRQSNN